MNPKFLEILRFAYLLTVQYLKRKWRMLLGIFLLGCALLFLLFKLSLINLYANSISLGLVGTYQEHDLPSEVSNLMSHGLISWDSSGRAKPNIALGWETNNDATSFKFKLKKDLVWSDGTNLSSEDLEFNIPNTEITYPYQSTINFKLKEPYSPFSSLLIKPIFKKGTLTGLGPYSIKSVEKSRIFITKMILTTPKQDLPEVIIRFYPNEKTAMSGFELGEVQVLLGVNQRLTQTSTSPVKFLQKTDYGKIVTILFSTKDKMLSHKYLRQALSFAAPKAAGEKEAKNSIQPWSWASSEPVKNYLSNPDQAKTALERLKNQNGSPDLSLPITLTSTPQLENVAQNIVSSWKNLGLNVLTRIESGIPQNFQVLLITQSIPIDPDQYFLWHSTQTRTNLTGYSFARVDKDLEDGRKIINEAERKEKYLDFQKELLEDAPATFLYFPKYNVLYLKKAEDMLNKILPLQLPGPVYQ